MPPLPPITPANVVFALGELKVRMLCGSLPVRTLLVVAVLASEAMLCRWPWRLRTLLPLSVTALAADMTLAAAIFSSPAFTVVVPL